MIEAHLREIAVFSVRICTPERKVRAKDRRAGGFGPLFAKPIEKTERRKKNASRQVRFRSLFFNFLHASALSFPRFARLNCLKELFPNPPGLPGLPRAQTPEA